MMIGWTGYHVKSKLTSGYWRLLTKTALRAPMWSRRAFQDSTPKSCWKKQKQKYNVHLDRYNNLVHLSIFVMCWDHALELMRNENWMVAKLAEIFDELCQSTHWLQNVSLIQLLISLKLPSNNYFSRATFLDDVLAMLLRIYQCSLKGNQTFEHPSKSRTNETRNPHATTEYIISAFFCWCWWGLDTHSRHFFYFLVKDSLQLRSSLLLSNESALGFTLSVLGSQSPCIAVG